MVNLFLRNSTILKRGTVVVLGAGIVPMIMKVYPNLYEAIY